MTSEETRPSENATVFKIVGAADWQQAVTAGRYDGSADDRRDGYIHLSLARQVHGTLAKYFRNESNLILVAFNACALGHALKFEASRGGDLFPHLYAPLPTTLALWQRPLTVGADGVPIAPGEWLRC